MPEELELLAAILSAARPGHFWLTMGSPATGGWCVILQTGDWRHVWTADRREDALRDCHDWLAARGAFDGPEVRDGE